MAVLSPHKLVTRVQNVKVKIWSFLALAFGAFTYFYLERRYKLSKRKNPLNYQFETDPNAPVICRRAVDTVPSGYKSPPDVPMDPKDVCDPGPKKKK